MTEELRPIQGQLDLTDSVDVSSESRERATCEGHDTSYKEGNARNEDGSISPRQNLFECVEEQETVIHFCRLVGFILAQAF